MQEIKFDIYGEFIRPNGHQQYDILSYIAETREEAIATCKRLNPHFNIITNRGHRHLRPDGGFRTRKNIRENGVLF